MVFSSQRGIKSLKNKNKYKNNENLKTFWIVSINSIATSVLLQKRNIEYFGTPSTIGSLSHSMIDMDILKLFIYFFNLVLGKRRKKIKVFKNTQKIVRTYLLALRNLF